VVKAGKGTALGSAPGNIDRAGATATVDVVLDGEAARVYGTVYKLEGGEQTTVPGVPVYFKHFSAEAPWGQLLGVAVTDLHGAYAFDGVPVGPFQVSAVLNTRDRDAQTGTAVAGTPVQKDLLIVVPEPEQLATVGGQVYMTDRQTPASDVAVSVGGRGVISADGSFTIPGVAVHAYPQTVTAQSRDGRRSGSTTVVANEPRLYDQLQIVLSGLGHAAFRVLDEAGQPVKGQRVALLGQCGNPAAAPRPSPTRTAWLCSGTSRTVSSTARPSAPRPPSPTSPPARSPSSPTTRPCSRRCASRAAAAWKGPSATPAGPPCTGPT
jgi:hypothetical protein